MISTLTAIKARAHADELDVAASRTHLGTAHALRAAGSRRRRDPRAPVRLVANTVGTRLHTG